MKKEKLIFLLVFLSTIALGQNKKIASVNEVLFKIKNSGFMVDGHFKGVSGTIMFDPKNLASSYIDVSIEANSINTGNTKRDSHLRKTEYFDVANFPKITFKSKRIEPTKSGYVTTGNLTIKGTTKEIKIPFTYTENNGSGLFSGFFTINRLEYGVGESSWILSDIATVLLNIKVLN